MATPTDSMVSYGNKPPFRPFGFTPPRPEGRMSPPPVSGGGLPGISDPLRNPAMLPKSAAERLALAKKNAAQSGYRINPSTGVATKPPQSTRFAKYTFPNKRASDFEQGPNAMDQLQGAAFGDYQNAVNANAFNWQQNQDAISGVEGLVGGIRGRIEGTQNQNDAELAALQQQFSDQGNADLAEFDKQAGIIRGNVDKDIASSVQEARNAVTGYEDRGAQDVAATVQGLQSSVADENAMIDAGINPDGSMMTPAQQADAKNRLRQQTQQQIGQVATQAYSQINNTMAQLRMALSGTIMQGGALRSQTGTTLTGQRLGAEQGRREYGQIVAGLGQMRAQMRTMATASAIQDELNGRMALADLKKNNPESPVSLFSTLAALFSVQTAPGAGRVKGFNVPQSPQPQTPMGGRR